MDMFSEKKTNKQTNKQRYKKKTNKQNKTKQNETVWWTWRPRKLLEAPVIAREPGREPRWSSCRNPVHILVRVRYEAEKNKNLARGERGKPILMNVIIV